MGWLALVSFEWTVRTETRVVMSAFDPVSGKGARGLPTRFRRIARDDQRPAFTLVELLVVIAIVGILVSLLIPAVQASRESARRATCLHHLRQIGLALHTYHTTHESFPVGCTDYRPWQGDPAHLHLAWSAFLLPFLDEQQLYDLLDLQSPFDGDLNARGAAMAIRVFRCPTSRSSEPTFDGRGRSDYGGIYGERINGPNQPAKGIMVFNRAVSLKQITDGGSHTIIVGEDTHWPEGQWINGQNVFDQAFAINVAPHFENDIRSDHPGGAQVVFADGHAGFLAEDLELYVLGAICTRAGGEVVSGF